MAWWNFCLNPEHLKEIDSDNITIDEYERLNEKLESEKVELNSTIKALKDATISQVDTISKLQLLQDNGWDNPYGWSNFMGEYDIITGISYPANTCITINDKNMKMDALKLKGKTITETATKIEAYLNKRVSYIYDENNNFHKGFIEWWQQASMTYAVREGDCDDYALCFQTMMHQCGYGRETITCASTCKWPDKNVGHAYNEVFIDGKWVVYDSCVGADFKKLVTYPDLKDCWFFCNYWGVYKIY